MESPSTTWLGISQSELADGVQQRLPDANKATVEACAAGLADLSPVLHGEFLKYWQRNELNKDFLIGSWSLGRLIENREMSIIGGFLSLDFLIRDPTKAEESLSRGYDVFEPLSDEARKKVEERKAELVRLNLV